MVLTFVKLRYVLEAFISNGIGRVKDDNFTTEREDRGPAVQRIFATDEFGDGKSLRTVSVAICWGRKIRLIRASRGSACVSVGNRKF